MKVSVLCVTYNSELTLEKTIISILDQTYESIEFVVVDGGSTDGTLDILKKYDSRISWISEPDRGIFDAMNKAVNLSSGDWLYFIGSDDFFVDNDVVSKMFNHIKIDDDLDVIFGNVKYSNGMIFKCSLDWRILFIDTLHHQGAFYRSSLFEDYMYNANYTMASDYELNVILYLNKHKSVYKDVIITEYSVEGTSSHAVFNAYKWEMMLRSKHVRNFVLRWFLNCCTISRFCIKRFFLFFGVKLNYKA